MFSQLRHAVETFAPQPRSSLDGQSSPQSPPSRSQCLDSTRRVTSPTRASKTTLEERLRASFVIGDASNGNSPSNSARATPAPPPALSATSAKVVNEHPLSPTAVPLPSSPPIQSPVASSFLPLDIGSPVLDMPTPAQASPHVEEPEVSANSPAESTEPVAPAEASSPKPEPSDPDPPLDATVSRDRPATSSDVEALQERLKLVELRFADVSTSFKRLQAEKLAADAILRELTPLETLKDTDALRGYLQNIKLKTELTQEEILRLNGKLRTQEERIEELRDTHRLESKSQSELVDRLRRQVGEAEALLGASTQKDDDTSKELERLQAEVEKAKTAAKEEEEKRTKAISLLKTVRQKLVKAERDKDEMSKELDGLKERDQVDKEKVLAEKAKLVQDMENANAERDRTITGLKAQFDKELSLVRERYEKEKATLRGQYEAEASSIRDSTNAQLSAKTAEISRLTQTRDTLLQDKNSLFDQLQLRQAELESLRSMAETLQSQNAELQYQLRENSDRAALLSEELADARRDREIRSVEPTTSSEEVSRLVSGLEAKYEAKLADLRRSLAIAERERNDTEAEWSRKLREKAREVDDLRQSLGSTAKDKQQDDDVVDRQNTEIKRLTLEVTASKLEVVRVQQQLEQAKTAEDSVADQEAAFNARLSVLEQQLAETKVHEAHLKANNKTLRDELRKVQQSAALLEKQRNPGVGYWTTKEPTATDSRASISSASSETGSQTPQSSKEEEELNLEYLRNVILQFLEHKEMRPHLVKVLSIILHFTPQETRRLVAKV